MKTIFFSLCTFFAVTGHALPQWLSVQEKDGSFRVEQIPAALLHYTPKWISSEQTPKYVKGLSETKNGAFRFSGSWEIGKQRFLLKEEIRETAENQVEYTAEISSGKAVATAEISLNFHLPLEILKGKSVTVDGTEIRYAETASRKNNRSFQAAEKVILTLPEGDLEITGKPFRVLLQDNRPFAAKNPSPSYALRLYPQEGGGKECARAKFQYRFTFRGIRSTPQDLRTAANRAFRDDRAGDGKGGWNDQGPENDLRMFKPGNYRFFGVEFRVINPEENGGRACIVLNGANQTCFLDSAEISCTGKGRYLYLLHANAFTGRYRNAGTIDVTFRDGSAQTIPVRNNIDVGNWWGGIDLENAPAVWRSTNSKSVVGLYMTAFRLNRDDPVKITFRKGEFPVWMIAAASLADRKAETYRINTEFYILPGKEWTPVRLRNVKKGTPLDLSRHLDAPAGKYGRVILSKEGKLTFEHAGEKRLRLLGVNICETANFPEKASAERFAEIMARAGYNTVRIHHFENGLNNKKGKRSWEFDPERMDRLDYLIFCLKQKGIYVTFDLYASRIPKKDELPKFGNFKVGVCFLDSYFENWKEFTSRLLNHVNPYTKLRWADDPVFLCLNLVNENPLIKIWRQGNEDVILAEYAGFLKRHRIDSRENREKRNGPFLRFLAEQQSRTIRRMKTFIRETIGSRILLTDVNCDLRPYLAHPRNTLDLVDMHLYHDHPTHPRGGWTPPSVFTQFSSISRYAETPRLLMPTRIFGKPFLVTEYQFCHPNNFIAEAGPLMGAYSALQDWDGLWRFQYSLNAATLEKPTPWLSYFTMAGSATMRLSDYITYFLFIRGDVRPAETGIALPLNNALFDHSDSLSTYSRLGLEHRIGLLPPNTSIHGIQETDNAEPEVREGRIVSSTGEILLDPAGEFKVITPKSECISTDRKTSAADRLSFRNGSSFQTISVHSLDNKPIGDSSSLLLFHLTDTKNCSEKFASPEMTLLLHYGKGPVLQKTGTADISLRLPPGNWRLELLNTDGSVSGIRTGLYRNGAVQFHADTRNALVYRLLKQPSSPNTP